jgi:translation elongation factor EF-Tu-like GTPase
MELPWLRVALLGGPLAGKSTLAGFLLGRALPHIAARANPAEAWWRARAVLGRPFTAGITTSTRNIALVDPAGGRVRNLLPWAGSCDAFVIVVDVAIGIDAAALVDVRALRLRAPRAHFVLALAGEGTAALYDAAEAEARAHLEACGVDADDIPVARSPAEVARVLEHAPMPSRLVDEPLRLDVLRGYSITGRGTVVVAWVEAGVVATGATVFASSERFVGPSEVVSLEVFHTRVEQVSAGALVSALLRGVHRYSVPRGSAVTATAPAPRSDLLGVELDGSADELGRVGASAQLYARADDATAALVDVEGPGRARLRLHRSAAMHAGDRFVLLRHRKPIAGGVILSAHLDAIAIGGARQ